MRRVVGRLATSGVLLGVVVAVVGFGLAVRPEAVDRESGPGVLPPVVSWLEVEPASGYAVTRWFVGRVEARRSSDLGFEIGGLVSSVLVDEGEAVQAGDEVARLDTLRLEAREAELEAAVAQARARSELAAITLARTSALRDRDAASEQEWDEAETSSVAARADLARAEAALASLRVDLDKAVLRSPFDGVVARRLVDPGRVVDSGAPVIRLVESSSPEVRVGVGGGSIDAVGVGRVLDVEIGGRVYAGRVARVLPTRDAVARGVDAVLAIDASLGAEGGGVREGDLARLGVPRRIESAGFWLPTRALTAGTRGLWSVMAIEGDGAGGEVVRRRDVEVLHTEGDRVYVRGVIEAGDRVVADGLHRVAAGMAVRSADAGGAL